MEEILRRHRQVSTGLLSGASAADCAAMEAALVCHLPAELLQMYRDHNGVAPGPRLGLAFRLLPSEEACTVHTTITQPLGLVGWDIRLFWTNDESDYAGMYVAGPLLGRVCVLSHEEEDLTPRWRSVHAFMEQMLEEVA